MFDDFKEMLSAFNAHNVRYLIVGGYAVSFYTQPRATKDLDIFIQADPANARATHAALTAFALRLIQLAQTISLILENLSALGTRQLPSIFFLESMG